ncbi:antibiotic biosynthesis monooxygenase [Streptomyces sp. CNQ085]|uniref:antibiotic biosynthesis monooxygenase n=1 Tax=Streptomyces sp. CNQ085 TaxID=2886944 RepID=UPI001F50AD50|nr:antibiotic biosynthesis monooxygenase [Streptomyces sp. CNQ085]MCI0386086.1 antibiotic biosynthesis monooxygenase [Streptomyces sp. CNQ085]
MLDPDPVVPGCAVVATFETDGPDRQRRIIDALCDSLESQSAGIRSGMLSANFHVTPDGTRVLNYAEWSTDEAHIAFLDEPGRDAIFRISSEVPGVRPIGFKRFHRHLFLTNF